MQFETAISAGLTEEKRVLQLAAARRKLSNFRSQRGSDQSSASCSTSPSSFPIQSSIPLSTELHDNTLHLSKPAMSPKGREKALIPEVDGGVIPAPKMEGHKRVGSMGHGHRRRPSSISQPTPAAPFRPSSGLYDFAPAPTSLVPPAFSSTASTLSAGVNLPLFSTVASSYASTCISPTEADPLALTAPISENPKTPENPDDDTIRARFTGFSFGSKPPAPGSRGSLLADSKRERLSRNSSPGHSPKPSFSASSSLNRLPTPLSRPPSLLVTRPTPLFHDLPLGSAPPLHASTSHDTPPSPARSKRHSHSRSNSISLPNLKLGRPQSFGVLSSSPSFPASPVSPDDLPVPCRTATGRKLKLEPSGRGAEAEKQRDESRRKALEKLTGKMSPTIPPPEVPSAEISLPDMDEDEEDSGSPHPTYSASEARSSSQSSLLPALCHPSEWERPSSISPLNDSPAISPTINPFSWTTPNQPGAPTEKWSTGVNREDGVGGLGFGLDLAHSKRVSMPSVLASLAEEEEGAEDPTSPQKADFGNLNPSSQEQVQSNEEVLIFSPPSSRLRELHLVSSSLHVSPSLSQDSSHTTLNCPLSDSTPTKPFGSAGRRPRPLSALGNAAFSMNGSGTSSPSTITTITTPKSASTLLERRRAQPGSGSRGSSISYKKEKGDRGSGGSSREWSFGRAGSPTMGDLGRPPPLSASTQFATWPRPPRTPFVENDTTNPQGPDDHEELSPPRVPAISRWARPPVGSTPTASTEDESVGRHSTSLDEGSDFSWRDSRLEMEMERDALREDAELWKMRCLAAEENLRAEKVETGVLWERVRKLGDRLSSVSSSHLPLSTQASEDSQLLSEMRKQLFNLTSLLEREQRDKTKALAKVAYLEQELQARYTPPPITTPFKPVLPSHTFDTLNALPPSPHLAPLSPIITPPTPAPSSPVPDDNGTRMRSWGFPSGPSKTPPKEKKRESFFSLSPVLRRTTAPIDDSDTGIDLPPFILPSDPDTWSRDTSEVLADDEPHEPHGRPLARSRSVTSSASSVVSFFSGYLGRNKPPSSTYVGDEPRRGVLDLRVGCKCCTGDVIEL